MRPARVSSRFLALALLVLLPALAATSQPPPPAEGERLAVEFGFLVRDGARPAWSRQGDWIAFDRRGADGFNDLYIAPPDNAFDRCLTCDLPQFRRRHVGNADWHPSGDYLVFQAEKPFGHDGEPYPFLAIPGRASESSLWVISTDGEEIWQLTGQQETAFPAHSARFSFEGGRLAWAERVASSGTWGDWVLRVAEFSLGRGVGRLRGVTSFEPAAQKAFYEVASFTPDDAGLLFSGNLVEGQPVDGLDLYTLDLGSESVDQLTKSLVGWDRHPAFSPDGEVVVWSSAEGLSRPPRPLSRQDRLAVVPLDLWLGAVDGSWTRRLTGFNDPLSDEYLGSVMVGPSAWSPGGDRILTTVTPVEDPERTDLFVVTLGRSFGSASPLLP